MRGSDLIGLPVLGPADEELGRVLDVRLVQDGPLLGAFAALRIQGFLVGHRRLAGRLGYDRQDAQGPWLLAQCVRWLLRETRYLPWEDAELTDDCLRARPDALTRLPSIA